MAAARMGLIRCGRTGNDLPGDKPLVGFGHFNHLYLRTCSAIVQSSL